MQEIPGEIKLTIKKNAEEECPNDPEMQQSVINQQTEAFKQLQKLKSHSQNQIESIQRIITLTENDHPDDYIKQIYILNIQLQAYNQIQEIKRNPQNQSEQIQKVIKEAESGSPDNFTIQLYILEEHFDSIKEHLATSKYLQEFKSDPQNQTKSIQLIIKKAESSYPEDLAMQKDTIEKLINAYEQLQNLKNSPQNQFDLLQGIIKEWETLWPDDIDIQISCIEGELELYKKIQELKSNPQNQSAPIQQIFKNAESETPYNITVQKDTIDEQLQAYKKIQDLKINIPSLYPIIKDAESDYPEDYTMQEYAINERQKELKHNNSNKIESSVLKFDPDEELVVDEDEMSEDLVQIGDMEAHWSASGKRILKYTLEMFHEGLNEHKLISAPDKNVLQNKSDMQLNTWLEKWNKIKKKEANINESTIRTVEAQAAVEQINNLLIHALSIDNTIDWESQKNSDKFTIPKPNQPYKEPYQEIYKKPDKDSGYYVPEFSFLEKIFKSKMKKKVDEYRLRYTNAMEKWEKAKREVELENKKIDNKFDEDLTKYTEDVNNWENEKESFYKRKDEYNLKIDELKASYMNNKVDAVTEYCRMVLDNSKYPESFPKDYEIEYNPDNKILIVEDQLPSIENFPNIKEVKYVATSKELKYTYIPDVQIKKMFEEAMYKIALRTIHELFEADSANVLAAISFNGWIYSINKATGKKENNCILSIQANKDEYLEIDLVKVDPKICFKNLKGVAASKLSSLTPIKPILQLSKTDKRFVESYNVVDSLENVTNLAAMDWEDFEHLIREIFEKEFSSVGGEVKVTQASRDGGVDAIAFDPDPIRGGKIAIQAKRYTNTVGVSAVRDLYGTVLNEGATKGILVTTSDYGSDAYAFAKGKPLTLLNGSNLLHLLEKHGHHAKIDIKEAKKILSEKE